VSDCHLPARCWYKAYVELSQTSLRPEKRPAHWAEPTLKVLVKISPPSRILMDTASKPPISVEGASEYLIMSELMTPLVSGTDETFRIGY